MYIWQQEYYPLTKIKETKQKLSFVSTFLLIWTPTYQSRRAIPMFGQTRALQASSITVTQPTRHIFSARAVTKDSEKSDQEGGAMYVLPKGSGQWCSGI